MATCTKSSAIYIYIYIYISHVYVIHYIISGGESATASAAVNMIVNSESASDEQKAAAVDIATNAANQLLGNSNPS